MITDKSIAAELLQAHGCIGEVAVSLGITRRELSKRIKKSRLLSDTMDDIRDYKIDIAEKQLFINVKGGEHRAIELYLKTVGKERGYSTNVAVTHFQGEILESLKQMTVGTLSADELQEFDELNDIHASEGNLNMEREE